MCDRWSSPDLPIPAFQHTLEHAHELAAIGAVDETMVEA
jgi:hypothetical protein